MKLAIIQKIFFSQKGEPTYKILGIAALMLSSITTWAQAPGVGTISFTSNRTGNFNIYLIDTNGENLQSLTNHPADEYDPTWSPDGRFLAYTSNRDGNLQIYVMDVLEKKHRRLTRHRNHDLHPVWSPDGQWIAFVSNREGNPDIYKMDTNGKSLHRLTNRGDNANPAWSPDSQWIAFGSNRDGDQYLYVMAADGKRLRRLERAPLLTKSTWSPDGKQIAFVTWDRVAKPNAKVKQKPIVIDPIRIEDPNDGIKKHPVFPDLEDPVGGERNIYVIDRDGENLRELIQDEFVKPARIFWTCCPAWSLDGDWITYSVSDERVARHSHIYLVNATGEKPTNPFQVTAHLSGNVRPTWVPELFFFVSPTVDTQKTLWGKLKRH